jgi:hypothetical protein
LKFDSSDLAGKRGEVATTISVDDKIHIPKDKKQAAGRYAD